ncbi:MAG: hypothetical protein K8L97_02115 [Anaerolineae bacterium]|nr:hypothetical protein [Anaerolineae bacterium]
MFRRRGAKTDTDPAINPNRTADLYALTEEGYIIAQDIGCQYELVNAERCPYCGNSLSTIAQISRAYQGLNELVALCGICSERHSYIFDISNAVYQEWWASFMGKNYVRLYEGEPRKPRYEGK